MTTSRTKSRSAAVTKRALSMCECSLKREALWLHPTMSESSSTRSLAPSSATPTERAAATVAELEPVIPGTPPSWSLMDSLPGLSPLAMSTAMVWLDPMALSVAVLPNHWLVTKVYASPFVTPTPMSVSARATRAASTNFSSESQGVIVSKAALTAGTLCSSGTLLRQSKATMRPIAASGPPTPRR